MSEEKPTYYAILTANVRYDTRLKPMEKLIYAELTCLTNKYGYSVASNDYFAELYEKDSATVSRWISHLEKLGYITIEYEYYGSKITKRKIFLTDDKKVTNDKKITGTVDKKITGTVDKKVKDNNTSINNTRINNIVSAEADSEKKPQQDYRKVYDTYLEAFRILHEQEKLETEKPIVSYPIVTRRLKHCLKIFSAEEIIAAIKKAMYDNWIVEQGFSLLTILSDSQLNKLVNAKNKQINKQSEFERITQYITEKPIEGDFSNVPF